MNLLIKKRQIKKTKIKNMLYSKILLFVLMFITLQFSAKDIHSQHNQTEHNQTDHKHSEPQFTPNATMPPSFNPRKFQNFIPDNNANLNIIDFNQKLQGMWVKESFTLQNDKGAWEEFDWHKGGKMYLIYDGIGGMALHSTSKEYIDFFNLTQMKNKKDKVSYKMKNKGNNKNQEKYKDIYKENYVYFGKYEIKGDTLIHTKISHTNIDEIGTKSLRKFYFEKNKNGTENLVLIPLEFDKPAKIVFKRYK